jgi:gas vesicle protein
MSDSPDVIRHNIEQTRRELGSDVDALADKVSPSKMVERQTNKVKGAIGSVRDRVMGAADDAGSSISHAGSSAASNVGDLKDRAVAKAEGNPLAVGLIAFGAGLLLSSLIPASDREKEVAEKVKEQAQPLVDEVSGVAKEVGEHLREPARDAATAVKEAAAESVEHVKTEAATAADDVKTQAKGAGQNVSGH